MSTNPRNSNLIFVENEWPDSYELVAAEEVSSSQMNGEEGQFEFHICIHGWFQWCQHYHSAVLMESCMLLKQ